MSVVRPHQHGTMIQKLKVRRPHQPGTVVNVTCWTSSAWDNGKCQSLGRTVSGKAH